ncbi:MAG: glycosyltransferase family 39 protein [Candidatus Omnitrophota bacterium]|nr:glycosyltransferase family 39 protein [Candidatus Omnitrophota bacterium]
MNILLIKKIMNKKIAYSLLLLSILLFHIVINYQILVRSSIPKIYDEAGRIYYGIVYFQRFFLNAHPNITDLVKEASSLSQGQCHPHLFDFLEAASFKILYLFNNVDIDSMVIIVNSFFLLILLISVYKIGSIIYDRNTGLLSAFLLSLFPLVFGHSRIAMLDYPLMCMVSLSVHLLLETKLFHSLFYSILAGIVFGLSQLTKETAILFILPFLIYYFIKAYLLGDKKKVISNFIFTVLFFIAISGIVYLRKDNLYAFKTYFAKIYYIRNQAESFYYVKNFINMIGPFILFLSLPLVLSYVVNIKKREKLLFVWFFVPLILFSLSFNKSPRFLLPILPVFALIIAGEIKLGGWFKPLRWKYGFILVLLALLQYALLNCGFLVLEKNSIIMEKGLLSAKKESKYALVDTELLGILKEEARKNKYKMKAVVYLFNIAEIHWPIRLNALLCELPYMFFCYTELDEADIANMHYSETYWREKVLSADYIINKSGDRGIPYFVSHIGDIQNKTFEENKGLFEMITQLKIPDGSAVYVYKKVK